MKKRILSCVLSAALLLGLTPWSALATDDPPKDQTSQTELQTNFQSPPQDPDIYSDPQPNITIGEDGLKSGTDLELVHATSTHTDHDGKTFEHKLTSENGQLYIDGTLQKNYQIKPDTYATETYYLAGDLTLDDTLYIRGGYISICLNGHSITQNRDKDVINVANDVYLSLYDCSEGNAGRITHAEGKTGRGIKFSAGIGNTFDMYGGTITGNHATATNDDKGGGVLVTGNDKGSFNLHGGVITGNSAENGGGVAVSSTDSNPRVSRSFTMDGGTISNNEAAQNGGGVYVENKGSATVSGGEIKGNTAIIGGGISGGGRDPLYITVSDSAKITGNRASTGGGVYAGDDAYGYCYFTMTGGEISGNTSVYNANATVNGGGVYLGGTMTVSGDAKIVNNKKGDEINNVFLPQNLVSKNYYTMTIGDGGLGSGASIGVTSSKVLADGEAVTIVSSGAASGSEGYFKADAGAPYNIQRVDKTLVLVNGTLTHKHPICGKKCTHTSKHEDVTWTAINSAAALQNAAGGNSAETTQYYYLTNDVTLDSTWTPSGYLALDLGDYALTTTQSVDTIQLNSGANLTLTSCGTHGGTVQHSGRGVYGRGVVVASGAAFTMYNVELTNHEAADLSVNGAGVYVNGGTFNMRSGSLVDNTSKSNSGGGGVLVDNGGTFNLYSGTISDGNAYLGAGVSVKDNSTFNMYGGTISGNRASDPTAIYGEGGGVYVDGSTFHMTGGEIKNNSASDAGGGVYVKNVKNVKNSTFTMTGGEINGNTAYKWGGGGVYVASTSTFIVGGKVTITGNKLVKNINNVYLSTNDTTSSVITLRSDLSSDSRIGVTTSESGDSARVKFATGAKDTLENYRKIFSSDLGNTYFVTLESQNLYIGKHQHTWNYTVNDKGTTITAKCSNPDQTDDFYTIQGGDITIVAPWNPTYDGTSKQATLTKGNIGWKGPDVTITYAVKKDGDTFVKMDENSFPTAVGTYLASISLTGVDKKTATASVEYTISKATLQASDFTFTQPTASSGQLVYDGKAKAATVTSNKGAAGKITVKYYTETGFKLEQPPTNAGTYTVKIDVDETESYQAAKDLTANDWKFTIAKADRTITLPKKDTVINNGKPQALGDAYWTAVDGKKYGEVRFEPVNPPEGVTFDDNGHRLTVPATVKVGTKIKFNLTAAESTNYKAASATFTVTVAAKSKATLTNFNMTGWTYGGEPNQPSYEPVSDVIEDTRKTTYATKNSDGTNSTFTEEVPTAAGNYTVKVTFETAFSVYTGTADFTISPKSLTQKMVSSIQDQTYCANAWEPDVVVTDGNKTLVKNSDYTVSYTDNINAGTAKVKVTGQGNYKGTAEATFVIDPAPLTITGAEVAAKTYDGTKTATINGVTFGGLVPGEVLTTDDYQITDAQFNSANVSDAKKVTVTVALKVTDKAKNYTLTSPTYSQAATISKATQNISVPQDKTLVKNGAGVDISQWVSVSGVEGGSPAGAMSYALNGNYPGVTLTGSTLTAAKNTTANTVTIKVTAAATQNYEGAEATFSVKLSDKLFQSNFQFASDLISKTYGNDSFTVAATGAAEGSTVSYTSDKTSVATVDSDGHVTIVGAGEATITATAAETKDYASASASYTLTVAQAKLTITAKDQSAYIGDKVPELGADSYTVTGLVKGESLTTALTILPTVRYVDENGQKVEPDMKKAGETVIRASGAAASGNYVIVAFTDGKLTVSARPSSGGGGGSSTPSYPVSTPSKGGNGSVSSNAKNAASGSTVTITVKPDSGYQLETLAVTDHRGNALKLTDQGNGTYTFTMPSGQVDVKATFTQAADETSPFDDVSKDDYYYDAVKWAADSGITGGVGGSLFGSDQSCTRAQIITFLWRASGSPEPKGAANMTDVPQDAYYAKAVAWAMENGITSGTGADRFSPHAACTRAQGMTFLFRSSKASVSGTLAFQDVAADAYYAQAVKWAADNGITSGIGGGLFGPDNGCTRAQIVTFLWKLYAGK